MSQAKSLRELACDKSYKITLIIYLSFFGS
jgi:hypothetical protein